MKNLVILFVLFSSIIPIAMGIIYDLFTGFYSAMGFILMSSLLLSVQREEKIIYNQKNRSIKK